MSAYLFAYGTLQPEYAPPAIAHVVARLRLVGNGFASGVLYDLGGYPGAVPDPSSNERIRGVVLQLPDDASVLRELDAFEEFYPDAPERSPFLRILHPVVLATGGTLQCWVYVYNRNPASARILPDGIYRRNG
jgi:gamma-glutamylcyclotransferase (GGCT)/AIG2-like uncharacterized protein YtfP